jgi:hypothetical protein
MGDVVTVLTLNVTVTFSGLLLAPVAVNVMVPL